MFKKSTTDSQLDFFSSFEHNLDNAIKGFVFFDCVATGILQLLSLRFREATSNKCYRRLRTISSAIPSEETVKRVVLQEFYHGF